MITTKLPSIASMRSHPKVERFIRSRSIPETALEHIWFLESMEDFITSECARGLLTVYRVSPVGELLKAGRHACKTHDIAEFPYPAELDLHDSFLVFPVYNENREVLAFHCRRLCDEQCRYRYITIEFEVDLAIQIGFGRERLQSEGVLFVCEGVLDSLYLPNAISSMGYGNIPAVLADLATIGRDKKNTIVVLDNEYIAPVLAIRSYCWENGYRVVIWPGDFPTKDLSEYVAKTGVGSKELEDLLLSLSKSKAELLLRYHFERILIPFMSAMNKASHYHKRLRHYICKPREVPKMLVRKLSGQNKIRHTLWDKDLEQ
jgi:hypothetical protein